MTRWVVPQGVTEVTITVGDKVTSFPVSPGDNIEIYESPWRGGRRPPVDGASGGASSEAPSHGGGGGATSEVPAGGSGGGGVRVERGL